MWVTTHSRQSVAEGDNPEGPFHEMNAWIGPGPERRNRIGLLFNALFPIPAQRGQYSRLPQDHLHSVQTNGYYLNYCVHGNGRGGEPDPHAAPAAAEAAEIPIRIVEAPDDSGVEPVGLYHAQYTHVMHPEQFFMWGDDTGRGIAHQLMGPRRAMGDMGPRGVKKIRGMRQVFARTVRHDENFVGIRLGSRVLQMEKSVRRMQRHLERRKESDLGVRLDETLLAQAPSSSVLDYRTFMECVQVRASVVEDMLRFYSAPQTLKWGYSRHIAEQKHVHHVANVLRGGCAGTRKPAILFLEMVILIQTRQDTRQQQESSLHGDFPMRFLCF